MSIDIDRPALTAPAPAPAPARTTPPGSGLSSLRAWRRARDRGAGDEVREAALSGPPVAPLTPASGN